MDKTSQEQFDLLVVQEPESLSTEQLGFLMARRSYMNAEQKKRFANEIELHEEGKLFPSADKPVSEMNLKELKAHAKALGLEVKKGAKEADILAMIEEASAE